MIIIQYWSKYTDMLTKPWWFEVWSSCGWCFDLCGRSQRRLHTFHSSSLCPSSLWCLFFKKQQQKLHHFYLQVFKCSTLLLHNIRKTTPAALSRSSAWKQIVAHRFVTAEFHLMSSIEEINKCTADIYSEVQPAPALTPWVGSSQISTVFLQRLFGLSDCLSN